MQALVFANQKGGVGKSALLCQFAHHLKEQGRRVFVIDLDHQANSTKALSQHPDTTISPFSATDVLEGRAIAPPNGRLGLIPADTGLSSLERIPDHHNAFVTSLRAFLAVCQNAYDVCLIDTNPNPDIRYAAAMISADKVLAPIQLNQEAIDGIGGMFGHPRYGLVKIKATLNPNLTFMGILPNLVEPTPFQRTNFETLVRSYPQYLLKLQDAPLQFAFVQKRSAIAEAQAGGQFVADLRKTAARDAWKEIKPVFDIIEKQLL